MGILINVLHLFKFEMVKWHRRVFLVAVVAVGIEICSIRSLARIFLSGSVGCSTVFHVCRVNIQIFSQISNDAFLSYPHDSLTVWINAISAKLNLKKMAKERHTQIILQLKSTEREGKLSCRNVKRWLTHRFCSVGLNHEHRLTTY